MEMSLDKREQVYEAIHENIMDLRMKIDRNPPTSKGVLEVDLFKLTNVIWRDVKIALNIKP